MNRVAENQLPIVKKAIFFLAITILGSVVLDQVSKYHAHQEWMVWQDKEDITQYQGRRSKLMATADTPPKRGSSEFYFALNTNYVRNLGAAWGFLSDTPDSFRIPFFYGVTILALFVIWQYFRTTPPHHTTARFGLALILSGALGNLIDRVHLGFVIDWIDVRWNIFGWRYDFPNFNVADSAITIGVSLLMIDMIILESKRQKIAKSLAASE